MHIHVEALEIECIIGLLPFERKNKQKVIVDIEAQYKYSLGSFIDYSKIVEDVSSHLIEEEYELLEDALLGIKGLVFRNFSDVLKLQIKISKPNILKNCSVGLSDSWTNTPL